MNNRCIVSIVWIGFYVYLLTLGCSNPASDQGPLGFIAGRVTDSLTSFPIESAWVDVDTVSPYFAYTNSQGNYIISAPNIPAMMSLFCGRGGYKTKMSSPFVTIPGDTVVVNFELAP
ncbi:MAG TPA: carboxypeptidase-like regulatory domain-containing protein [candidate division Zixibacteria bacterium]|nr:carboxypeptidase-like regulatory domain-containing protein [candidate division Zixibacteria bacterium]